MKKSLSEMQDEVTENCKAKGWYDSEVSFGLAMALLHSEVSEALEAWRQWGLNEPDLGQWSGSGMPKPEGVGSEFADILIRWLDYNARFFGVTSGNVPIQFGGFGFHDSLGDNLDSLHRLIAKASYGYEECDRSEARGWYADIVDFLVQLAKWCSIDLDAEYERKMAYNRTRSYRHGGKRA